MPRSTSGSNISHVKHHNKLAILQTLLHAPMSRVELAQALSVSSMTATNLVRELTAEGLVATFAEPTPKGVGRPRTTLCIQADARFVIGVQIGVGVYWICVANLVGEIVEKHEYRFSLKMKAADVLQEIGQQINRLQTAAHEQHKLILGVGVGASGLVDNLQGVNHAAPSLGWYDVPIRDILQTATGLPIAVENNVRAMALAESFLGDGQTADSLAFVFGRDGLAAGFVIHGRLLRGAGAGAGEIGHIKVTQADHTCRCGQTGCLETMLTEPILCEQVAALGRDVHQVDFSKGRASAYEQILTHGRAQHPEITALLDTFGRHLGQALATVVNTLNPEIIFLGGMYAQGIDLFLPVVTEVLAEHAFYNLGEQTDIRPSTFGLDAGTAGAATLALIEFFYQTKSVSK